MARLIIDLYLFIDRLEAYCFRGISETPNILSEP